MLRLANIGIQRAHAAHQHGHFRRGQRQQLRLIHQLFFRLHRIGKLAVIAETIGLRLKHREAVGIRLLGGGIRATRREGHRDGMASRLRRRFYRSAATKHDQIGERDLLAVLRRAIERLLHAFQRRQHLRKLPRLIGFPILLGCEANARAIGATATVRTTEGGSGSPGGCDQFGNGKPCRQDLRLQRRNIGGIHQLMRHRRHGVLPDQVFLGHIGAEVTHLRPHIAMRQLEPGAREGIGELFRILQEAMRNRPIDRIELHRHIRRGHDRRMAFGGVMRIRHGIRERPIGGDPLMRASGAFRQHPIMVQQVLEVVIVPLGRVDGPGAFDPAGNGMHAHAGMEAAHPAKPHLLKRCGFRFRANMARGASAMALAEGMATCRQRDGFFVIHRHAGEGFANIAARGDWIRITVRAFRIDVNQTHLHGSERVFQNAVARVALVIQPGFFGAPIDILFRFPDIHAPTAKAKRLQAHGFNGAIAGQDEQIGPGNLVAVFLLHRPQQAARLVQIGVIGPGIFRREAMRAIGSATPAIGGAIGAGSMPGHAHKEGAVMPVIRRPPGLRHGHQRKKVVLQRLQVQLLESFGIAEARVHRVGLGGLLAQDAQVQLIGPPIIIGPRAEARRGWLAMHHRAFAHALISVHLSLRYWLWFGPKPAPLIWHRRRSFTDPSGTLPE